MSKKTITPATYDVALVNMKDGGVQGHKAGCGDLTRVTKKFADEPWTLTVANKREAYLAYNADFIAESGEEDGHWDIEWLPCAKHVPAVARCAEHPAYDADYCPTCGTATPISERPPEHPAEHASTADEAAAAEFTAEPAEQPEFAALATKDWRGNYNTVFAPAAEQIAAGYAGVEVRTVSVSTMLKQTDIAGPLAKEFLDLLVAVEAAALAATKAWQKTLDRKGATDMEKFNQNRSFLAGYLGVAAQRQTGAKKSPVVPFAKDMDRAVRPEALKAGAAAAKAGA